MMPGGDRGVISGAFLSSCKFRQFPKGRSRQLLFPNHRELSVSENSLCSSGASPTPSLLCTNSFLVEYFISWKVAEPAELQVQMLPVHSRGDPSSHLRERSGRAPARPSPGRCMFTVCPWPQSGWRPTAAMPPEVPCRTRSLRPGRSHGVPASSDLLSLQCLLGVLYQV